MEDYGVCLQSRTCVNDCCNTKLQECVPPMVCKYTEESTCHVSSYLPECWRKSHWALIDSAMGMKLHRVMETRKTMPGYGCVKGYRLYGGKLYLGFHATKSGATKALKEAQGCKPRRQRSIPRPLLRVQGIRTRRGKDGTWSYHAVCRVPNDRGKTYLGSAKNIKEVAAMVITMGIHPTKGAAKVRTSAAQSFGGSLQGVDVSFQRVGACRCG